VLQASGERVWCLVMTDILDALLTRSVPTSLRGRVRSTNGAYPDDMEVEDGYPSDAAVEAIGMVAIADAARWMRDVFPLALGSIPYALVECEDEEDDRVIHVSTGGWSGVEAVVWAVLDHPIMRLYRSSEQRGGHYVFRVPLHRGDA
jgi:hypothetical protein